MPIRPSASIERQLPLLVCALSTFVVLAMALLAYRELHRLAAATAETRLVERSRSWAELFALAVPPRIAKLEDTAASAAVQAVYRRDEAPGEAALAALRPLHAGSSTTAGIELRDADGEVVLLSTVPDGAVLPEPPGLARGDAFGPLYRGADDAVHYDIVVPVDAGAGRVGTLVERRRVSADATTRQRLDALIGADAELLLGNEGGELWTDFGRIVEGPRVGPDGPHGVIEYERDGERRFVATASIPGTPWIAAYELPRSAVFRPVRRSVMRLGVMAAGSLVIGAAGAWLLSRRLTSPLRELMGAVGAIAAGDHERRVRVARADELGQLGAAFNAMADRVTEGRATLEAKVEDRTRALRVANVELARREQERTVLYERLSELDRLKTEFFVNVSHELRTPLTLVLSPIRKLLAGDGLSAEQRAELETVRRSATLLLKHVDDLLDVTKLEAGRVEIAYAELDLAALVRWIASNFGSLASERGISYDVRAPESLVAEVDPDKVQRILVNLLSNALKFTPRGGAVQCALQSANGHAVLMVSDSGPGIARELRERVFERFYQTAASLRVRGGTGLGLTIARELAQLHDGSIRIEEAATGGALVLVELPLRAPEGAEVARGGQPERELDERVLLELAPRPAAPEREPALEAGAPLVLVIEDNRAMNAFLAQALSSEFRVLSAFDGAEGVRLAAEAAPDLIVTDVMMPRADGEELIRAVRAHAGIEDTPILVLTARADDETRARLIRAGAQDCLGKPFLTEEVLARAGALVEGRRRAEAALLERNRLLRAATEGLTDAVFVKDRRSCYLALNSAAARLLGHAADDVVGKDDTQLMPPEFAHATMALEREILAGGRSITYEFELDSRGARRTLLMTKGPYRDEGGRTIGVVGVCRDITERKQAEEALRETNCALLGANEDLEHLVHALSHDLQEPLRMVAIYAQLLRKKYGGRLDAEADESIGFVIGAAERMHQLLQGILAYSRLDQAGREPVRPCEASSALQQALLNLDASVREHRAVVTSSALPRVRVQETHLLQLFQNLVGNAIKFHGDEPPRVHVSAERSGAKWLFSVRDNGIGIEPQYADRVFRIFKRLHGRELQGAGIGLAICKRIVERYGGEIWVDSEPGRGACFRFTAPPE